MSSLRRVLVVAPYGIGDLLFVSPVLRALRLVPTVEKVDLLLGSRTDIVVRGNPHVDEIFCVDKDLYREKGKKYAIADWMRLSGELKLRRYDLLLDYSMRAEHAFCAAFLWNIPRRAGFEYKSRGMFLTDRLPVPDGFAKKPAVHFFCDVAEKAGIPVRDRFLEFYLDKDDRTRAREVLSIENFKAKRWVAVSPGGGESWGRDADFKRWPVRHFVAFLKKLHEKIDFGGVILLGSPGEKNLCSEIAKELDGPALVMAGPADLRLSAALIEGAVLFVGNDGGLVHIAHSLKVPVIAFYGPADPVVYGPYPESPKAAAIFDEALACRPCYYRFRYNSECEKRECLQELAPEKVFRKLEAEHFFDHARQAAAAG